MLALATVALPSPAPAQQEAAGELAVEARELFAEARVHHENKDWQKARELYQASFSRIQNHITATHLGHVEMQLKRYTDAAEHLTFALWFGPMETNDEIERERERLRHEIARALREAAHIKLELEASNAVTSITVNGRPLNLIDSPWGAYVEPGEHRVVVRYREAKPVIRTVRVAKGKSVTLKFTRPEPDPESELPRGPRIWGGGLPPPDEPEPPRKFKSDAHIAVVATGGGLALISGAIGGYALVRASSTRTERDQVAAELARESGSTRQACATPTPASRESRCAEFEDLQKRLDTERTVGLVGIAASSLFSIGTAAVLILWPDDKRRRTSRSRRPSVSVTPTSTGMHWAVAGQF